MSYTSLLINTCDIERYGAPTEDNYGQPILVWAPHLPNEACRLMATTGRELKVGAELVIADYKLFLGNVDITEQDRVIVGTRTYEVLLVTDKQDDTGSHHKECFMRIAK